MGHVMFYCHKYEKSSLTKKNLARVILFTFSFSLFFLISIFELRLHFKYSETNICKSYILFLDLYPEYLKNS